MRSHERIEKSTHPSCRGFFSGWIFRAWEMYYYQFHIGDYRSATLHLSNEEDLAYRRLLDMYYDTEKPIPLDISWVAKRIKIPPQVVRDVLFDMFIKTDDGYINSRCDKEIAVYKGFSDAGKRGAAKRWGKGGDSPPITPLIATNNQEPITNNHSIGESPAKKERTKGSRLSTDFDLPDSWTEFCQSERPDLNPRKVFDQFKDYWIAKAGASGVKSDWTATWRNWVRNQNVIRQVFNKADIAHVTVPSSSNRDPALVKLDEDRKRVAPPNPEVLAKIRAVLGKQA
jgi:uncharacterized protein YdaU (DUF1376 family)